MKNITSSLVVLTLMSTSLLAQQPLKVDVQEIPDYTYTPVKRTSQSMNFKAKQTSNWYNYFYDIENLWGADIVRFRSTLYPDSNVFVQNGPNFDYSFKLGYGQSFDPTSEKFENPIKSVANYTLDSISIPYMYFRPQKSNPDTLVLSIFTENQLNINALPNWSTPRSYSNAPYDTVADKGLNPAMEIVHLLTDADIQDDVAAFLDFEINMSVPAGQILAVTFSYFPGNYIVPGDTLGNTAAPFGPNTRNGFAFYDGRDNSSTLDNEHYNMGQWITKDIGYNILSSTNGWEGSYVPGVAYGNSSGVRHMDVNFKITYDDFTGINENALNYNFGFYPNPVKDIVNFKYDISSNEYATIQVVDVLGHLIKEVRLDPLANRTAIDLSEEASGLYFAKLTVNNQIITTAKIVKE